MRVRRRERRGFTLVELLMVILIVSVLMSLLLVGISSATLRAKETGNKHDITQLETALQAFYQKYNFYPPSRLNLYESNSDFPAAASATQLDNDSMWYLLKIAPRLMDPSSPYMQAPAAGTSDNRLFLDWNGNGVYDKPATPGTPAFTLEGDQCLAFFLGGIPTGLGTSAPGTLGFCTNPFNPVYDLVVSSAVGTPVMGDRVNFYEFQSNRLVAFGPGAMGPHPSTFFSYLDRWSTAGPGGTLAGTARPYAYFSSYKTANGYNRYFSAAPSVSDCNTLGVWPFAEAVQPGGAFPSMRYLNPSTFQIVSAGRDNIFSRGSDPNLSGTDFAPSPPNAASFTAPPLWSPAGAQAYGNIWVQPSPGVYVQSGKDDQANFYDRTLGTNG